MKRYRNFLFPQPDASESERQHQDEEKHESSTSEGALRITLHVLKELGQKDVANTLEKCE